MQFFLETQEEEVVFLCQEHSHHWRCIITSKLSHFHALGCFLFLYYFWFLYQAHKTDLYYRIDRIYGHHGRLLSLLLILFFSTWSHGINVPCFFSETIYVPYCTFCRSFKEKCPLSGTKTMVQLVNPGMFLLHCFRYILRWFRIQIAKK